MLVPQYDVSSPRNPLAELASAELASLTVPNRRRTMQQNRLGQFFTPAPIAQFMASMLAPLPGGQVRLLDAGAGAGALFTAAVQEFCAHPEKPAAIHITAYEVDAEIARRARSALRWCAERCADASINFTGEVIQADFIECAVESLQGGLFSESAPQSFTHALLNPPYRKIRTDSRERRLLHSAGVAETNLYSAFLALALNLLGAGGSLVAITPRSFCNGPYFKRLRRQLQETAAIQRIHVFESRDTAFSQDKVLQETVILSATKSSSIDERASVIVTSSAGANDEDSVLWHSVPYADILKPQDANYVIHIPTDGIGLSAMSLVERLPCRLSDLGLEVSTGRVVEFRARPHLRAEHDTNCAPLIASRHLVNGSVVWPRPRAGRPEALAVCDASASLLIPAAIYTVVKRMTTKEERRRIVAAVYSPIHGEGVSTVAFENHINYFHQHGAGLDADLAYGLAGYLNSTLVDTYVRQFNGHTQINASDLRALRYPTAEQLHALGEELQRQECSQATIDQHLQEALAEMVDTPNHDPILARRRIEEASDALHQLNLPRAQQNERSALTLLALLNLTPDRPWSQAGSPLLGVTQMMEFFSRHYGKTYAPNSRETVRRQTLHQFLDVALARINPDNPARPVNSGQTVYQIEEHALETLHAFGGPSWLTALQRHQQQVDELIQRYAQERLMARIPLKLKDGAQLALSPGGQNVLIERIIHDFAERFTPEGRLIYVGAAERKFAYYDAEALAPLGVALDPHGKAPDVIIYDEEHQWLALIEAVTSHGPVNIKRKLELERLFARCTVPLVYMTAFMSRKTLAKYASEIAWETEVWLADEPAHMIHFDGVQRIEPYALRTVPPPDEEE